MSAISLRRYTNLAATIHLLQERCLSLLSPNKWDDRNDAFFMDEYQNRKQARSLLALCFAEAAETYHHWRVFSSGTDGVCLEIDKEMLVNALTQFPAIKYGSVSYKTIDSVKGINVEELPFVKRYPYRDESEFRVVFLDQKKIREVFSVPISLKGITRITLSPWMPSPLVEPVKKTLKSINGCRSLKIYRSTLIDNERWKRAANPKLLTG